MCPGPLLRISHRGVHVPSDGHPHQRRWLRVFPDNKDVGAGGIVGAEEVVQQNPSSDGAHVYHLGIVAISDGGLQPFNVAAYVCLLFFREVFGVRVFERPLHEVDQP